jgi:sugar diacid utilization regulator
MHSIHSLDDLFKKLGFYCDQPSNATSLKESLLQCAKVFELDLNSYPDSFITTSYTYNKTQERNLQRLWVNKNASLNDMVLPPFLVDLVEAYKNRVHKTHEASKRLEASRKAESERLEALEMTEDDRIQESKKATFDRLQASTKPRNKSLKQPRGQNS